MIVKSIEVISLKIPFNNREKKIIFHGKSWEKLEINLIKVCTDQNIIGWGEAFGYSCWKTVKTAIEELISPLIVGKNLDDIPNLILNLQKSLHIFGRYGVTMFAISGVEIALWDALGKKKNKPIHELLGEKKREIFDVYSSLFRYADKKLVEKKCQQSLNDGFKAIKLHEIENEYIEVGRKISTSTPLMVDVNCAWNYEEIIQKKKFLEKMKLFWIEEPIYPPEDYEILKKLSKEIKIPIACGENACTEYEFRKIINYKAITYAQPSVIKVGGIYEMYKIILNCEKNNISVMPHSAYFGPGFLATLQLAALIKNDTFIERFYLDIEQEFYPEFKKPINGKYKLPSGPGLGMEFDHKIISKYEV